MKIEHLIFTCPECDSHEIVRIDRCLTYNKERSVRLIDGKYMPGETESELIELAPRGLVGLRCARCNFPDADNKAAFEWKNWKDVASNGCLSPDPDHGKEKVACTVVSLEGRRYYRTYALLAPGETLTDEQRGQILTHTLHDAPGVVVCERDRVEELPPVRI